MLAARKRFLQRTLRSSALADGVWRKLKRLPFSNPALDVVQTSFTAQLMERLEVLRGVGERTCMGPGEARAGLTRLNHAD